MTVPDWLAQRDGGLRRGIPEDSWLVVMGGKPLYRLSAIPAGGQFTCAIAQTVSGQRLDAGKTYPNVNAALAGGLEELRTSLGW